MSKRLGHGKRTIVQMKMLRVVLAVALLAFLFFIVDPKELLTTFANLDLIYIGYLLLLAVGLVWLSCLKWRLFIRAGGHDVGILHLMKLYIIGYFFNIFTPSYVGGDVARSYQLGKYLNSQKDAFVSTFLERFTGLLAMTLLGVSSVLLGSDVAAGFEIAILFVGVGTACLAAVVFSKTVGDFAFGLAVKIPRKVGLGKIASRLESLLEKIGLAIEVARNDYVLLARALWLSFCFHAAGVLNTYIAARAVGWENPEVGALFVVVPLVLLVGMVPLTPSGIGITEGAFLFFLMRIGATKSQGLGVGLVLRAKVLIVAMIGGLLFLTIKDKKDPDGSKSDSLDSETACDSELKKANQL
jgi:hypothetical protein